MKILAVDTSTLTGSVALLEMEGERASLLGEITLSVSVQHSEQLIPAIRGFLSNAAVPISSIDLFAAAEGPGSFTGLRIGIATIQGFAFSQGKPTIGVSSLEALALSGLFFDGIVVPMLDARRGEIYAAAYRFQQTLPVTIERVVEETASPPDQFFRSLEGDRFLFLGEGARTYRQFIRELIGEKGLLSPLDHPCASHLALLAGQRYRQGTKRIQPKYIRSADVTFPRRPFLPLDKAS